MKDISVNEFKKKYPRQYAALIEYYGGKSNIFDLQAAIYLYLQKITPPKCSICDSRVSITKKFRSKVNDVRCSKHINSNNIVSLEQIIAMSKTSSYELISVPNKALTNTDQIEILCSKHGAYPVNIGNFLRGMKCQQCYHEGRIGKPRAPHSDRTRQLLSVKKTGTKLTFTPESKSLKTENQKLAWQRRRENTEEYQKYLKKLSEKQKKYIKENGFQFPNKSQTGLEKKFEQFLTESNIRYEKQYLLGDKKFDFYLVDMQLLVEVDGEYWHRFPSSIKNDVEKHRISQDHNIQLVRISSDNFNPEIIFEDRNVQDDQNKQILRKRGIDGF